ncbi:hypothetical protein [Escherichia coli]|uniref:hypothetical protein n=1 Tax=Escherichia coli TaxID=562 RepID=UPI002169A9EC|nr:hypothetical protein [Escherichia coli]
MKNIGVIGCLPELPVDFPLLMPENSGNMIHAEAPLRMFPRQFITKIADLFYQAKQALEIL